MKTVPKIKKIIELVGGGTNLAKITGISIDTIRKWNMDEAKISHRNCPKHRADWIEKKVKQYLENER